MSSISSGSNRASSSSTLAFGLSLAGLLALTVILPILAGVFLDFKLKAKPDFLYAGFVVSIISFIFIMQRSIAILNKDLAMDSKKEKDV